MKYTNVVVNVALLLVVFVTVFQIIPSLLSEDDWLKFSAGVGLMLVGLAAIVVQGVKIYNTLIKGKE